jgi:hypothetical protein
MNVEQVVEELGKRLSVLDGPTRVFLIQRWASQLELNRYFFVFHPPLIAAGCAQQSRGKKPLWCIYPPGFVGLSFLSFFLSLSLSLSLSLFVCVCL